MVYVGEQVNVWVFFRKAQIEPYIFFWRSRKIKIDKINLVHTAKEGSSLFYFFSVSSGSNFYLLKFDLTKLKWSLEKVEED